MKKEKTIMGMTIKIEIADKDVSEEVFAKIFSYFEDVDRRFSTYKGDSEISKINHGLIKEKDFSVDMREIFRLSEETKKETEGYFDILTPLKKIDPSGIVKGWAICKASQILKKDGYENFYIDAGGDVEVQGRKGTDSWKIGIRNPLNPIEVIKVVSLENKGIATSGNYVHKKHIYNPKINDSDQKQENILSLTVVGPNIYEADRFATAAYAMGEHGIYFIENLPGFEGYAINNRGIATMTSGFENFVK